MFSSQTYAILEELGRFNKCTVFQLHSHDCIHTSDSMSKKREITAAVIKCKCTFINAVESIDNSSAAFVVLNGICK